MDIIRGALDNDLYKYTQMQAVMHHFPTATARYQFVCRNNIDLLPYREQIQDELIAFFF